MNRQCSSCGGFCKKSGCERENVKPEPEPVAWVDKAGAVIPHSHKLFKPDIFTDYTTPLYTAPPQRQQRTYTLRKWQGLTDKEIEDCLEMSIHGTCRAIEAKLKEKNSAT